jgi:hypothetical protein
MPSDRLERNLPTSATHRARRLLVPLLAACALVMAALPVSSASAASVPPEGIFENCQLDTQMSTCLQRLDVMHGGGFNIVVIDADSGSPSSDASYAASARALGMKVMWEISNTGWWDGTSVSWQFPGFVTACGCSDNSSLLSYMIKFLGSLSGTYGYYAADDSMLGSGYRAGVARYVSQIKTLDPTHRVLLSSADESQTSQYESIGDMNAAEIYPIATSSLMPVSKHQDDWSSIGQWAKDVQGMSNKAGKSSAFILQAFSWGDNLSDGQAVGICSASMSPSQCWNAAMYPTAADQLQLRNEILKHAHPGLILWWSFMGTYGQAGGDTYSLYPTGTEAAKQWAGLTAAINAPAPGVTVTHSTRTAKHHRRHRRHHHRRHHHRRHRRHHRKPRRSAVQLRHPRRLV